NVSPESFHAGSVYRGDEAVLRAALGMVEAGAVLVDVGARSTAPYLANAIDEGEETAQLAHAVELLAAKLPVPVSADTPRPGPGVFTAVSCLRDRALARLVASHGASLVLMAAPVAKPAPAGKTATSSATAHRRRMVARRSPVIGVRSLLARGA